jgi:hypothetical protein
MQHCDTYILKPDYEPEPEYAEYRIYSDSDVVGELRVPLIANPRLVEVVCRVSFAGFYRNDGRTAADKIQLGDVATAIHEGHKVVARFRKG